MSDIHAVTIYTLDGRAPQRVEGVIGHQFGGEFVRLETAASVFMVDRRHVSTFEFERYPDQAGLSVVTADGDLVPACPDGK